MKMDTPKWIDCPRLVNVNMHVGSAVGEARRILSFLLWSYRQVFQLHGSQAWVACDNDRRHVHVLQRIASGVLIADHA